MFKLFIVFLVFLKIKSESESNFMENKLTEEITLGIHQTDKVHRSGNIEERLYFKDLVTKSGSGIFIGKIKESNHKPIEGNRNKEFSLFQDNENEVDDRDDNQLSEKIRREKLLKVNGITNLNSQGNLGRNSNFFNQFAGVKSVESPLLVSIQPTKALQTNNAHKNKLFVNMENDRKKYSKLNSRVPPAEVNEAPYSFSKTKLQEGIDEEDSNKNYDTYDISKYKSDSRNECIPNVNNKESTKNAGPQILFDREQGDGPQVSLMYTLINLKTLRPKSGITFTDNRIVKKCTTQDQCKRLTKASTCKPTLNFQDTVTCQEKEENNMTKTYSNKSMSSKRKTTCIPIKDGKSKNPYTPLLTVQPWPELTLTRNSCFSTKLIKTHLASPLTSSSPSPPPSMLSSVGTRPQQSTRPSMTQNNTLRGDTQTENTFPAVPSRSDQLVNTTISSEFASTNSLPTLPCVSTEVAGLDNTYSTQETKVETRGRTNQTKPSVIPSSLVTDPLNVSQGNYTNLFTSRNKCSTTESNMVGPLTSCKKIEFSVNSSSSLPGLTTSSQVQPKDNETVPNRCVETNQSTTFIDTSQKDVDNTGILNSSCTVAFTNRLLTSSPVPESVNATGPGMESTPLLSSKPPDMSIGTLSGIMAVTQTVSDQNQSLNDSTTCAGVKPEVRETTFSLNSKGKYSSVDVENTSTSTMKNKGQDEWNDSYFGPSLQPTVTEEKTIPKNSLSSDESMNFSPPPPVVFSHEPQFIATLFNDAMGGKTECIDLSRINGSYTIDHSEQSEPEPSQLKDLFASPETITPAVTNSPPKDHSQSQTVCEVVSPATVATEPNQSILLRHLKSFTSYNHIDTFSKGAMNAYFDESKDIKAVSNCLVDYSRMFSNLETKRCE